MIDQAHGSRLGGRLTAVAALLFLAGALIVAIAFRDAAGPPPGGPPAPDRAGSPSRSSGELDEQRPGFGRFLPGSRPVALTIPRIDVDTTSIVPLDLATDGTIEVPQDPQSPGWFRPGPTPGQLGPAVIAGHVDSRDGPAIFYRLGDLRPGDRIDVTREDGSVAHFVVHDVESYTKSAFPTRKVYGATPRAELRLITCGGAYDPEEGYLSNTVAFARLV